jgi:putative integral membrane protein (TIGR02587 family)
MAETSNEHYGKGLARAFGGAIVFVLPLLMTMEMWWLGFSIELYKLLVFVAVNLVILIGLSYFAGFQPHFRVKGDLLDAMAAFGVGFLTSAAILWLFGIIRPDMPVREIVGKIALQTVPASIGAMLARKQLGKQQDTAAERHRKERAGYPGELFLMMVGALFLAFNVAPTEEMILIAFKMPDWQGLLLGGLSIVLLHAFVYTVGFAGEEMPPDGNPFWLTFLHYSIAGYGIAILVSLYVLWTFGRTGGAGYGEIAMMVVVLGLPSALGAATARLII